MDEQLSAALAAVQRVEEVLYAHRDSEWAAMPETQEIAEAISDINTMDGGWEVLLG